MSFSLAAIAAIAGSALQSGGNVASQLLTNRNNRRIAKTQNATEIELANSAHQREVNDLKAAGLNPILSAGGTGAATPNLEMPTQQAPEINMSLGAEMLNALSDAKLKDAQAGLVNKQTAATDINMLKEAASTKMIEAQTKYQEIQNDIAKGTKQTEIHKKQQELDNLIAQFDEIQSNIYNKQTNTAMLKAQLGKYNEITDEQINQLKEQIKLQKAQTKYTNERARGYSTSTSGNVSGGFGLISGGGSHSETY